MNTKPLEISLSEWAEIMQLSEVREGWGLDSNTTPEEFASSVYGVKFDFMSGSPGYFGDLYILQGDGLDMLPLMIVRDKGKLRVRDYANE